jgi:hypothetical protein
VKYGSPPSMAGDGVHPCLFIRILQALASVSFLHDKIVIVIQK